MQKHIDGIKITTLVIFILVTAAVFLALGYWAGSEGTVCNVSSIVSSKTATTTVSPTASATASASATADATANWKTYTNSKYGLSFKYPTSWSITKDTAGASGSANDNLTLEGSDGSKMIVWVNPDGFGLHGATDYYKGSIENGKIVVENKEKIEKTDVGGDNSKQAYINLQNGSDGITISLTLAPSVTDLTIFDQILFTFQFTK